MALRILLLTTDAYGGHGGIALYNRDIAEALAEMPNVEEVTVIPRNMPLASEPLPEKIRFLPEATGGKARYIRTAMVEARKNYDLVICGHINLLPLAALLNLFIRSSLVLMVYGIDVWQSPYRLARQWLADVDTNWPKAKYALLPNAIHLERYGLGEKRSDLLTRYQIEENKLIMTLARLPGAERYKGVDEVLEIMSSLLEKEPTLKYLVAGDGDDRPRLEAKAQSLGLADRVIFTGMVKEEDKADLFRLADVFVMPGRGEGFGFVFLEALACGVPAVGSQVDGSREALRDGMLGELVDPTDHASIKQGILRALTKPKEIPQGLSYFAWPAFALRVADAVRSLVK